MISAVVKTDVKQQEIKELVAISCKKYPQNCKYTVKQACIFHLFLLGTPSNLILFIKNRGMGFFYLMDKIF